MKVVLDSDNNLYQVRSKWNLDSNPNTYVFKELIDSGDYPANTGYLLTDKVINNEIHTKNIYLDDNLIPQKRAIAVFWADGSNINPIKTLNLTCTYISNGLFGFTFDTNNKPTDALYDVSCSGIWKEDEGYSNILTYNIHSRSVNGFRVKQYRIGNNSSDNHSDSGGRTFVNVSW